MAPLKIGILGAARIADDGVVDPSRVLGHRLVAVAARDRSRAEAFAVQRGVERVHQTYAEVIDDPEVEVVYNARPVRSSRASTTHHPVNKRLRELVTSGELGDVQQVDIELSIPGPPGNDPRWSLELAGGATMDLGCYVLSAARQVGRWLDEVPSVVSAEATLKKPNVDASMRVELDYSRGIRGRVQWNMDAKSRQMVWTVSGTEGTAVVPAFAVPHMDNRIVITRDGSTEEQTLGRC
jgi:predicted dehydrogenase